MKTIPLTQGYVAQISDKDYARVRKFKWCAHISRRRDGTIYTVYARGCRLQLLHRFILGITDPTVKVDHRDHNGLNCQRRNMRRASHTQNMRNGKLSLDNTSGFIGVAWAKWAKLWESYVRVNRKKKRIGYFTDKALAAKARDREALKQYGKFAVLNFPKEGLK